MTINVDSLGQLVSAYYSFKETDRQETKRAIFRTQNGSFELTVNSHNDPMACKLAAIGVKELWDDCKYIYNNSAFCPIIFTARNITMDEGDELIKLLHAFKIVCPFEFINVTGEKRRISATGILINCTIDGVHRQRLDGLELGSAKFIKIDRYLFEANCLNILGAPVSPSFLSSTRNSLDRESAKAVLFSEEFIKL